MTVFCRAFNVICAALGLGALSPALALIAIAIRCDDGGPVLYFQTRVGRNFQPFRLIKFRTMAVGADRAGLLTAPDDTRVTRRGRFLRRYKLDELPQLWNVINGDMQLVGPRPEVERYVIRFHDQYSRLLNDRPGITDPASLAFRREEQLFAGAEMERQYLSEILPQKLELSLEYQRSRTFISDIHILLKTVVSAAC